MSDRTPARPAEHPELTPERNVESAVRDTFPASDAISPTASQGARAVPADRLMQGTDAATFAKPADAVTLTQSFPDPETAKLALETLVREGPVDRRCTQLDGEAGGRASVTLHVPQQHAERISAMLRREAGHTG
jgi:hypothetical protein